MKKLLVLLSFYVLSSCGNCVIEQRLSPANDIKLFEKTPVYELAAAVLNNDTVKINYLVKEKKLPLEYREKVWDESVLTFAYCNRNKLVFNKLLDLGADVDTPSGSSSLIRDIAYDGEDDFLDIVLSKRKISRESLVYAIVAANDDCLDIMIKHDVLKEDTLGVSVFYAVRSRNYNKALLLLKNGVCFNDSAKFKEDPECRNNSTITDLLKKDKSIFFKKRSKQKLIDFINENYRGLNNLK